MSVCPVLTFEGLDDPSDPLLGPRRDWAEEMVTKNHYAHSVPSGKSHYFLVGDAIYVFSIPANQHIGFFLLGNDRPVWELSRMWAPDGHTTILTAGLAEAISGFRRCEPTVVALVSYADPNQGHEGGIYRAASWVYTGQSDEGRAYLSEEGQTVPRRKFHSGDKAMVKAEIEAQGYTQVAAPGKHRFAKGLTAASRKVIARRFA